MKLHNTRLVDKIRVDFQAFHCEAEALVTGCDDHFEGGLARGGAERGASKKFKLRIYTENESQP